MRSVFAILVLLFMTQTSAVADMTVKQYRAANASTSPRDVKEVQIYVFGLGVGLSWGNSDATLKGRPLYCQPGKLALGVADYLQLLDDRITSLSKFVPSEKLGEFDIGLLLLEALQETFPCPSSSSPEN
jgi:hypothetical protein